MEPLQIKFLTIGYKCTVFDWMIKQNAYKIKPRHTNHLKGFLLGDYIALYRLYYNTFLQSQWEVTNVTNAVMDKGPILTPINKSKAIRALELHYTIIQFLITFLCNK